MSVFKKLFLFAAALIFSISGNTASGQNSVNSAKTIINRLEKTAFPADTFWVSDYGAKADGISESRAYILEAIKDCSRKGGGLVMLSGGTFFCKGPISLKNNVIHLQGLNESPLDKITFQNISVEKAGNVFGKMENFRHVEFKRFLVSGEKIKLQIN